MDIALTTRWNAGRHQDGEAMIAEILEMGFSRVELGYDLRMDLVPGVLAMVEQKAVTVGTVHNFCPVPMGAPKGHPELFTFASKDARVREQAIRHTRRTIEFAQEVGADTVVSHSGNVDMPRYTYDLIELLEKGEAFSPKYEKLKLKLQVKREKKSPKQLNFLRQSLDLLLPALEGTGVVLALENLPTWEAFPTESEITELLQTYAPRGLRYWHDIGHGQIRENIGMIYLPRWLERLSPYMAGMHVHDVAPAARDHVMPPRGGMVNFDLMAPFAKAVAHRVIEPSPNTPREDIVQALEFLNNVWGDAPAAETVLQQG
jgi:sugar phosphate isomerase/epimerase